VPFGSVPFTLQADSEIAGTVFYGAFVASVINAAAFFRAIAY